MREQGDFSREWTFFADFILVKIPGIVYIERWDDG
jgi:hypothetical protein